MKPTNISLVMAVALFSVACGDKGVTAENVTVEECEELFPEDGTDESEGDFDDDGDADEDDVAIEDRCVELLAEGDAA
jgi:hypothetical protein